MIMLPAGSVTGSPEPIAAAIDSSTRIDLARLHPEPAVLDRAALDRRDFRRDADDESRPHEGALPVRLPDEIHQHLLGRVEVGDDAVLHRPNRLDVRRGAPEHLVGLDADRFDLAPGDVEGHDGWFVEDDAAAARKNAGIGGSEIDRHVGGKGGHQAHDNSTSFAGGECIRAQFMIRSHSLSARKLKSFRDLSRPTATRSAGQAAGLQT